MNNNYYFYNWFQKIISILIDVFFIVAPLASLFVFTSTFQGWIRIVVFVFILLVYIAIIYFFKDYIFNLIKKLFDTISNLDEKKMIVFICLTMIILKIIYSILFGYDATSDGDIQIYNEIADNIISTGQIHSDAISHLFGVALHFVVFKLLHFPLDFGIFIVFFIGTIINFISFKDIIGKTKAFFLTMVYIVMPSSALISFCPTHELFVYMYLAIFFFFFNKLFKEDSLLKLCIYSIMSILSTVLTCLVNPGGYILLIIMILVILLTNVHIKKKIIILLILVLSYLGNNLVEKLLEVNTWNTAMNTYTILIHGSNPFSLGEQVDGYPLKQMRMYIYENTMDFSREGFLDAGKNVLIQQYIYLLTHPIVLIRLIMNKIYVLWSGVHYPLELANHNNALNGIMYYILLVVNTIIYLFMITMGLVYKKDKNDYIYISNYKLAFLGVFAVTMLSIVANKYSLYITGFIYLITMYRIDFRNEKH